MGVPSRLAAIAVSLVVCVAAAGSFATDAEEPTGPAENVDEFLEELSDEADETIEPGDEHEAERAAETFPCNIFSAPYLEKLVGVAMDGGAYALVSRTEDAHAWKSDACSWQAKAGAAAKAELWISQAKHFDGGKVQCYPPLDGAEPITGIGERAWWSFQRAWGIGTLRVCTPVSLLEVKVTRPGVEEAAVRQSARLIAQRGMDAVARSVQP